MSEHNRQDWDGYDRDNDAPHSVAPVPGGVFNDSVGDGSRAPRHEEVADVGQDDEKHSVF